MHHLAFHSHLSFEGRVENVVGEWEPLFVGLVLSLQILSELETCLLELLGLHVYFLFDLIHVEG